MFRIIFMDAVDMVKIETRLYDKIVTDANKKILS